jgi:hypothetical protein
VSGRVDAAAELAFKFVERETGFGRSELAGRSRRAGLVRSRAMFAWALRHNQVSYARIGRALERDRDEAFELARIARNLRKVDPNYAARCDAWAVDALPKGQQISGQIVAFIESEMDVDRAELAGSRTCKAEIEARAMFVWAMRAFRKPQLSWRRIGAMIGRDGDNAHHLERLSARLQRDNADFAAACGKLIEHLAQQGGCAHGRTSH